MEIRVALILVLALVLAGCKKEVDLEKDRESLLASNERQRVAHMTNDPHLLALEMADTVLAVQRGQFRRSSREDMRARWKTYFASFKYSMWDDLEPPVIDISGDGEWATVAVRKMTVASFEGQVSDTTYFAWSSAYHKVEGRWLIYMMTSTRVLD